MSKNWFVTLLVFAAVLYSVWAIAKKVKEDGWLAFFFPIDVYGPIGMNDGARLAFCAAVDSKIESSRSGTHVRCSGKHADTAVISLDDGRPLAFGRVDLDSIPNEMRQSYRLLLAEFKTVPLYIDKVTARTDPPVPVPELAAKAEKLGVKTIGDCWAACGFRRYLVRNEEDKLDLLDLKLSNHDYSRNPTVVYALGDPRPAQ
jgi:hypothetical protein